MTVVVVMIVFRGWGDGLKKGDSGCEGCGGEGRYVVNV